MQKEMPPPGPVVSLKAQGHIPRRPHEPQEPHGPHEPDEAQEPHGPQVPHTVDSRGTVEL